MKLLKSLIKPIYCNIFPYYVHNLKKEVAGCDSVLDLGCGPNSSLQYCEVSSKVGVELFDRYLEESRIKGIHDQYIKGDVRTVNFEPKSFDAVILIDVLEHLTKEDGKKLLEKMEAWARKKIIIFTPNGFVHQIILDDNKFQEHKSGWTTEEFYKLGFKVYGMNGWKNIRGPGAAVKFKPKYIWIIISDITQKIVYYLPKVAFHLFAIKKIY